ncbi:MAG: hypothetical protein IT210_16415 [Armatimonadetes bacterium]|nr:hypothetical protein [Armatimonadota bacterium]
MKREPHSREDDASSSGRAAGEEAISEAREKGRIRGQQRPRFRAVALGLALIPLLCGWSLDTEIIVGGTEMIESSFMPVTAFALLVLTLVNDLLRRRRPELALTRAEVLLVFTMLTASVGVAGLGQIQFLNQALGGFMYFASAENNWSALHPWIPRWWVPDPGALRDYYLGDSTLFTRAHIMGWARPVLVWTGFIVWMAATFLCLNTLLRRHWVEQERLSFPLAQLPLELTREGAAGSLLRHPLFWTAFMLAFSFRSIAGIQVLIPSFPSLLGFESGKGQLLNVGQYLVAHPWNAVGYLVLSLHPMILGITYFLPLEIAFSAWFFYLTVKAENVAAAAMGLRSEGASQSARLVPYTAEQGAGAFLAIALLTLWSARHHLRRVARKAFRGDPGVSDKDEPLSYRAALFGLLAGLAGLLAFTGRAGLPWPLALGFFILYFLFILTITRLRAEAGQMLAYGPEMSPQTIMTRVAGTRYWSAGDLVPLSYLTWFDSDFRTVAMPQQAEALKMGGEAGIPPRWHSACMLLAIGAAAFVSFILVLTIYYHHGAVTPRGDNPWRLYNGTMPFYRLQDWVNNPTGFDAARFPWIGIGAAVTAFLVKCRALFVWWPFHPAGFALAHAGWTLPWVWFPMFLSWAAKSAVLRYGGMRGYRRCIPFFLGLIFGDIAVSCLWSLLGIVLDMPMYMFFPG